MSCIEIRDAIRQDFGHTCLTVTMSCIEIKDLADQSAVDVCLTVTMSCIEIDTPHAYEDASRKFNSNNELY